MASPIVQAIKQICEEKHISYESVIETIEAALAAAYRKDFGEKNQNVKVMFDPETAATRAFDVKTVVEDMELPDEGIETVTGTEKVKKSPPVSSGTPEAPGAPSELEEPKWNPKIMIMISEAKKLKPDAVIGEELRTELVIPGAFGRMAAQTAKQVIMQKLREAERQVVYDEYKDRTGQMLMATVQRREGSVVLFDLGRATALMLPEDQIEAERYMPGERLKVYVNRVALTPKGPEILVSRTHPELVRNLFTFEIPEVASGAVEIKVIAREAGSRSKVAVRAADANIDPIGSCIGQRGTRIQTIIGELGGEKIDIIAWDDDPAIFIAHALSPAKVQHVELREAEHTALVRVVADQLSLAIGRGGQNVRLAAKLSGWKINVVEEKKGGATKAEAETGTEEETVTGAKAETGTESVEEKSAEVEPPSESTKEAS